MSDQPSSQECEVTEVFKALELVNAAIAKARTSEEMLALVLEEMLSIFACDRAWLLYPCVPTAEAFRVPMERTREEWPGASELNIPIPIDESSRGVFNACLAADGPVRFDATHRPLDLKSEVNVSFHIRSQLLTAIWPKGDDPWVLGIHHCSEARSYGSAVALFQAIGNRVADGLTSFLTNRKLRQSEERFRTIVHHAPEAIVIFDCDINAFIEANPNACKLFGYSREELTGSMGPSDLSSEFQPDGRPSEELIGARLDEALAGEIPVFEWSHLRKGGSQVPCEVRLARLPHPTRSLVRGSITDISRRKAAELQHAELEARLAQSQKMEAIGQLTGGIAHDFNNLLTVILGNLDLLVDAVDERELVLEHAANALAATERACSLTHRLLAFSRRQPLRPRVLLVHHLLRDMDDLLRRTLGEDIEIELVLGGGLWKCEADSAQLENAILNLAINARDAMPEGGLLTIEASNARLDSEYAAGHEEVKSGQYVLLAVTDNGRGMEPDVLERIFAPFFTTKEVGKGSGLGLSMVYGFIKQSGGHVKAYSEVDVGTTMKIYLPRTTDETPSTERSATAVDGYCGKGETILVVEDEPQVLELTSLVLTQLGYRVLEASTGAKALELLGENSDIDLLLTDVVLPGGMNGAELARLARGEYPTLRVLYMSGYTENSIIHNGRLDANVNLVEKPFTKRILAIRVREALAEELPK